MSFQVRVIQDHVGVIILIGKQEEFFSKTNTKCCGHLICATSLFESYEITKNKKYLNTALSTADFILNDLKRTKLNDGFLFSYSPISGNNKVYNASMLGCKVLSYCYKFSGNEHYIEKLMKRYWLVHKARTKTAHGFMENTQYKFGRTVFIQVMFWKVFLPTKNILVTRAFKKLFHGV